MQRKNRIYWNKPKKTRQKSTIWFNIGLYSIRLEVNIFLILVIEHFPITHKYQKYFIRIMFKLATAAWRHKRKDHSKKRKAEKYLKYLDAISGIYLLSAEIFSLNKFTVLLHELRSLPSYSPSNSIYLTSINILITFSQTAVKIFFIVF